MQRMSLVASLWLVVAMVPITATGESTMQSEEKTEVSAMVDQWIVALNAMFAGDPKPFAEIYSHADDVTYMGAEGTYRIGWDATYADWEKQAAHAGGGHVEATDVHIVVGVNLATATHYTQGNVTGADGKVVEIKVRETSVFRKEDGVWKMIGHQADDNPVWVKVVDE